MSIDAVDLALYDHAIERRAGDPDEPSFSAWLADNAPVLVAECRRLRRADFILSEIRRFERLARQLAAVESAARLLGGGDATRGATGRYCFCGAPSGSHAATCDDLNTLLTTAAGGEHAHRV
jgi:hypothetical protein